MAEIRAGLRYVAGLSNSVGIAGFSFGAGPALLAAADLPSLRIVGSFGGYADLRHVIVYITTGAHEFEGRRYLQPPLAYNRWKLLAIVTASAHHVEGETIARLVEEFQTVRPLAATPMPKVEVPGMASIRTRSRRLWYWGMDAPDVIVDVTDSIDRQIAALLRHESQVPGFNAGRDDRRAGESPRPRAGGGLRVHLRRGVQAADRAPVTLSSGSGPPCTDRSAAPRCISPARRLARSAWR